MPFESEQSYINVDGSQMISYNYYKHSQSNRNPVTGKVDHSIQSPFSIHRCKLVSWYSRGKNPDTGRLQCPPGAAYSPFSLDSRIWSRSEQRALAKFRGKLRKGSASLGITLATYGQTRDMLTGRYKATVNAIVQSSRYLSTKKGRARLKRDWLAVSKKRGELTANQVLEGFFGWAPLIGDIRAVMNTMIQLAIPPAFVVARDAFTVIDQSGTEAIIRHSLNGKTTIACTVQIENPNLWLASRAGVLNPFTVAWDLVPWSWVVNMFTNMNVILGQFSDYAGLSFGRQSVTKTGFLWTDYSATGYGGTQTGTQVNTYAKTREVGSIPSTSFMFRAPEFDVSLALISSALIVQRIKKINGILTSFSK